MRPDVLEAFVEETGRPVDPLASFLNWDGDGRRRLDGMTKGRRWDLDHEHLDLKKDSQRLFDRLRYRRWLARNRDHAKSYWRWYWNLPENVVRARARQKRKRAAERADPVRWARRLASFERHKAKKQARSKERYRANLELSRARARVASARYYDKLPREGKRRCSLCHQPGHNRLNWRKCKGPAT